MAAETQALEARFEQISIIDQNEDPAILATSYHKSKVCHRATYCYEGTD